MARTLRLILGDQLNLKHRWFEEVSEDYTYVMMEVRQETDYVRHHIQKMIGFFQAMRTFQISLEKKGYKVLYLTLDDPENAQSIPQNLKKIIAALSIQQFEYQEPDEYRLDQQLSLFCQSLDIPTKVFTTDHFLCERFELKDFFSGKKTMIMESFYRHMRKKHSLLMDGPNPIGGKWNFDHQNRKKLPKKYKAPSPHTMQHDVSDLFDLIKRKGIRYIGEVEERSFIWPKNREESMEWLDLFIQHLLPYFGTYQDAMRHDSWSLFHSRLSFSLNTKMLHPMEVVEKVITYGQAHKAEISIAQVEGFVRQIIGWREYMRGIYWSLMPDYRSLNYFDHVAPLPTFYWTGKTKMTCLQHAITQSLKYAYAHHIQRLMVTGNFALLAGVHPDEVDQWYLGIYIDAIEWVEITNTRGMSQFADGGIVATKPYISSANYINKMSDYCGQCYYDPKQKTGPRACPFNSLYWHFLARNIEKLKRNPRMSLPYRIWEKFATPTQDAILDQAERYLQNINAL